MEVKGDTYRVAYDGATETVIFEGALRLRNAMDYNPINELLDEAAQATSGMITLDLRDLGFLNSAGINLLLQFAIKIREQATTQVIVLGTAGIPWQERSLPNMKKLMPRLQLTME